MAIRHISFLQLGDVHYPELKKAPQTADHKDRGISDSIAGAIGTTRIAEIVRRIGEVRRTEPEMAAILLCGDLTTKGELAGYVDCLKFLSSTFQLNDSSYWADKRLVVVPGNHDIDRRAIKPGQEPMSKFSSLTAEWDKVSTATRFLFVDRPEPIDLPAANAGRGTGSIRILPLNTCFMCGEYRRFPERLRELVGQMLDELKRTMDPGEFHLMMSEQVDCPAVDREHVDELFKQIEQSENESVAIVLAHHPLFPQPTPRIDSYAELLNAGFVREKILSTKRNVIYLHGHIHQEPVLVVNSPGKGANRIVHISAPALEDGFNLIRIFYSSTTDQPLGLELVPYRFGDHLGIEPKDSIKLRLIDADVLWNEIEDPLYKFILGKLASPNNVLRFQELTRNIPEAARGDIDPKDAAQAVKEALVILELLELVQITNRDRSEKLWQCRRTTV